MSMKKAVVLGLLAGFACTQVGCLFGASSRTTTTGKEVPPATFNQIEPGKTTGAFVKGMLDKPDSETKLDDGTEIWRWNYTEKKVDAGYVFLVFGGANEKVTHKSAYVQVKDGVVVRAWRE